MHAANRGAWWEPAFAWAVVHPTARLVTILARHPFE